MKKLYLALIFALLISSCTSKEPSENIIQTAIAQTQEAQPTFTNEPIHTLVPTKTRLPTLTPMPTKTKTSVPTPTPLPEPIVLTGTGDSIVDFDNTFDFGIVHIIGNAAGRYFMVKSYGADNEPIDLLVNATDPYDGVRPFDFGNNDRTTRFEIKAIGDWKIEILPISQAHTIRVPGKYEGEGDDVLLLIGGGTPDLAYIKGNAGGHYFGVWGYSNRVDLLVNTTDPYDGSAILDEKTIVIEIRAVKDWSIEITTK